jgi:hypothetical protein
MMWAAEYPPMDIFNGVLTFTRSAEERDRGMAYYMHLIFRPLSFQFSGAAGATVYISFLRLYEFYAMLHFTPLGFQIVATTSQWGIRYGFVIESKLDTSGLTEMRPKNILEKSFIKAMAFVNLDDFNSKVLGPINFLANLAIDGAIALLNLIPSFGDVIVSHLNTLRDAIATRFEGIIGTMILSFNEIAMTFEFKARLMTKPFVFRLRIGTNVEEIIKAIWREVIEPVYKRLADNRGLPLPMHCSSSEEQFGILCAPKCRSQYRSIFPGCLERCRSGYKDLGAGCLRIRTCGVKKKAGVPYGCKCSGYIFLGTKCIKKDSYWKDFYLRAPSPIHACFKNDRPSKEYWTGLPMCWKECPDPSAQVGIFSWCTRRETIPKIPGIKW